MGSKNESIIIWQKVPKGTNIGQKEIKFGSNIFCTKNRQKKYLNLIIKTFNTQILQKVPKFGKTKTNLGNKTFSTQILQKGYQIWIVTLSVPKFGKGY
jgi:hypothetical protein